MKSASEVDRKADTNLTSITLADKNNYKISLFTDNRDKYRLSFDWNSNNTDIPSIAINPQLNDSQTTENSKRSGNATSIFIPPPPKFQGESPHFLSTENYLPCISPTEFLPFHKEEQSSETFDRINGELDFQHEQLGNPQTPDIIHEGEYHVNKINNPIFMNAEFNSLKSRITNIEMRLDSIHTMITEINEWVQCQKGPMIIEAMSGTQNIGKNITGEVLINNNCDLSNPYSPSQSITVPSLPSALTIPSFQSFSSSQPVKSSSVKSLVNEVSSEIPSEFEVMELKRRSNTRRNFAAKLAMKIFGEEGLMMNNSSGKCPEGTIGRLDSTKMIMIKSLVFQHWPLQESEGISLDDFWRQECLRAIDEKGRYLRFQKKNVYKRMLWKKRTGLSGYVEQATYGNLNTSLRIIPNNILSGSGDMADISQSTSATCLNTPHSVENNP